MKNSFSVPQTKKTKQKLTILLYIIHCRYDNQDHAGGDTPANTMYVSPFWYPFPDADSTSIYDIFGNCIVLAIFEFLGKEWETKIIQGRI